MTIESSQPKILVAMPAYDEERYIGSLVLKARQYADEVIVVDNGSQDQTAEVARLAGATVIRHAENKGKGTAIQTILAKARERNADVLVLLDSDCQHNPDDIPRLIAPIREGVDLVIGSREGEAMKTPWHRRFGQKVLLMSTHLLSGERLNDSEFGFRSLFRKAISEMELRENGFAVETEMIASANDKKLNITQVAISNIYTEDGSTQNPVRHGVGVLLRIVNMISERHPLFFFGLGGLILLFFGLLIGARALYTLSSAGILLVGTAILSTLLAVIGTFSIFTGIILDVLARRRG
jgi:glycosyltransferase involved in cell wall biosynthesis